MCVLKLIRQYGSTLYVGMAPKQNGRPYNSIATNELKSLLIYTDMFKYTLTFWYWVFLLLTISSRCPQNVFKVEDRRVAKQLNVHHIIIILLLLFHKNTFLHFFSYKSSSSTNTNLFIVKFHWSIVLSFCFLTYTTNTFSHYSKLLTIGRHL